MWQCHIVPKELGIVTDDLSGASVSYGELVYDDVVNGGTVKELNSLLLQLSKTAAPLTTDRLFEILDSGVRFFVARDGDKIISTTLLCQKVIMAGNKGVIEDVVTDEAYRGRGIAEALMRRAMAASQERGDKCLDLTSRPSRVTAGNLYERLGFQLYGTRYYRFVHNAS